MELLQYQARNALLRYSDSIPSTRLSQTENRSRSRRSTILTTRKASLSSSISSGLDGAVRLEIGNRGTWTYFSAGKEMTVHPVGSGWTSRQLPLGYRSGSRRRIVVAEAVKEGEQETDDVNTGLSSGIGGDVQKTSEKAGSGGGGSGRILSFLCPLLKLVGGGDPAQPRNAFLEAFTSGVASIARLPWGSTVQPDVAAERSAKGQPQQLFQIYEFEACPFCRRVREALTELDLSAEIYPCPKGSLRHREFVRQNGGKEQFPYFVDPNTGATLYESSEIVNYLFKEYGNGKKPSAGLLESTLVTGWVPTLLRAGRGMMLYSKASSTPPPNKLELFSYENNQFARLVREALCELELPYILRNAGKGSSYRDTLLQLTGSTRLPYLIDSNTGVAMPESLDIITYLFQTYGAT